MASIKVSDLQATTSTAAESFLYVADTTDGGVGFDSKKITVANFLNAYATEAFVSTQISDLINGAPEALNTLKEISDVIGDSNDVVGNLISMIDANETHVDNVATLTGVAKDSADMGSFSGSTIADSSTIKAALQALETSLETKGAATDLSGVISNTGDLVTLSGVAAGSVNLGVFDGDTLSDNATLKVVLQDAEDAIEANASAISSEASSRAAAVTALTNGAVASNTAAINQEVTDRAAAITALTNGAVADNAAGIVTNAAAITSLTNGAVANNAAAIAQEVTDRQAAVSAEATARADADALLMPKAGGTFTGAISGPAPTADGHLATKKYADDLVANVDLSQVETNRVNIAAETSARISADTALSGRLDVLEADPTTGTALQAEASTRASADTALSNRVTSLEADPTTQTLLNAETTARTSADTALSGRLDTLEADPTTQALLDAETAARLAGDELLLSLAGGTLDGDLNVGSGSLTGHATHEIGPVPSHGDALEVFAGTGFLTEVQVFQGDSSELTMLGSIFVDGVIIEAANHPGVVSNNYSADGSSGWFSSYTGENALDSVHNSNAAVSNGFGQGWIKYVPATPIPVTTNVAVRARMQNIMRVTIAQGGGASSTIGADGTASFGGAVVVNGVISSAAVPTQDVHLVNKLYADNLVAGVDLSGIATNAAAIEALTNGAPELLNTLAELGDAIGDDANFATTITNQITNESTTRASADTALSGRLDVLEADPTTASALTTESNARASADTALSNRLNTLEADPTTQTLLTAEATTRAAADTALSGRLDTLEADPTTATSVTNAIAVETAARIAGDALLLPLAGGTMSGAIQLGSGGGVNEFEVVGVGSTPNEVFAGTGYLTEVQVFQGTSPTMTQLHGIVVDGVVIQAANHPGVVSNNFSADGSSGWYVDLFVGDDAVDSDLGTNAIVYDSNQEGWIKYVPTTPIPVSTNVEIKGRVDNIFRVTIDQGAGGAASTLGVDGTATFGSTVSASAVPTADAHLVNKLYADQLVANVDLSQVETNRLAIIQEISDRAAAITALTNGQVATNATNISANATAISQEVTDRAAAITSLTNGQVATNTSGIATNTSGIATNATAITNLTNGAVADNAAAITALTNGTVADNTAAITQEVTDRQAAIAALTNGAVADNAAAITALTNGAVADNAAAVVQEAADRAAADALKVDKQSLVNEHLLGQTSAQSAPVDAQGNSNYLFLVVDKATGALKSIDKTFLEAE